MLNYDKTVQEHVADNYATIEHSSPSSSIQMDEMKKNKRDSLNELVFNESDHSSARI